MSLSIHLRLPRTNFFRTENTGLTKAKHMASSKSYTSMMWVSIKSKEENNVKKEMNTKKVTRKKENKKTHIKQVISNSIDQKK